MARQKSRAMLVFMIVLGVILGSAVGQAIGFIFPEGVVKRFFLEAVGPTYGPAELNLVALTLTLGISFEVNIMAVLGAIFAVYLFRWY